MAATAMQEALLKAKLVTEEQTKDVLVIPHDLRLLQEEIEELSARLPAGDKPDPSVMLRIVACKMSGDRRGALEAARDAMRRRLVELGL